jgi:YesN/AraC family two-component response regulator
LRLAVAKELLKEGKIKVKDVSVKVGYDNISYFTQLFSKKYGVTPNEYKKMV